RASCPNRIPVISKLALVLDIYSSLSLIWRYSYCPVFQGATSYHNGFTCEADTLGSCGYVYIAVYPTQR
ncbi:type IV toxin-antitoxin system YeeU family antitoxin, partial [Klebsiella pneumoniae]|uniref:type IV toxin-antitoxin system YeeU family antitoxin n=1 Tax=Klebsiella pneumoniae TaxID=573 RepID=UPI003857B663